MSWNPPPERRKEARTVSEVTTYEPIIDAAPAPQDAPQRRRDEWLDCGHRGAFAVVVVVVLWLGMWIFWEVFEGFAIVAFVAVVVFSFAPMLGDINHRNRQSAARRALDDLSHAHRWETQALQLERSQHARGLFSIEAATQQRQLAHRTEQRAIVGADNRNMDAQHFLDAVRRGESPSKRSWTGRTLPSGQKMTAAKWSEITASLESQGILARSGSGTPYRLTTPPATRQAGTVAAIDALPDDAVCTLPR